MKLAAGIFRYHRYGGDCRAGFTLVELMIALVVLAILAIIAVPIYTEYVTRSNRAEGKAALEQVAQALERCMTLHGRYDHQDCDVTFPIQTDNGHYRVTGNPDADSYVLAAAPQGVQADRDSECATLTLAHNGVRGISGGDGQVAGCW